MSNIRKIALGALESAQVAKGVEQALELQWRAETRPRADEDPSAIRLEVANAARRWANRVLEEEFPDRDVPHGCMGEDDWDEEPTQPGKRPLPLPAPADTFSVEMPIGGRVIIGPRDGVVQVDTAEKFKEMFGVPPCGSRVPTSGGEYACHLPSGHLGAHFFQPDGWNRG